MEREKMERGGTRGVWKKEVVEAIWGREERQRFEIGE
jgi:hypothetical protein